jgi:hypothetical protein
MIKDCSKARILSSADLEDIRGVIRQEVHANSDIIYDTRNILEYIGLSRKSTSTFYRWVKKFGLPASKTPNGRWWISKRLVDQWMYSRHLMMAKAAELGIKGRGTNLQGMTSTPHPEKLSESQRNRIVAEIQADKLR